MREILFRGYSKVFKEWLYGRLVVTSADLSNTFCIVKNGDMEMDGHHIRQFSDKPLYVDRDSIGEFTGCLDKNGQKIFEGDIVRYYRVEEYGKEYWDNEYVWRIVEHTDCVVYDNGRFALRDSGTDVGIMTGVCDSYELLEDGYSYIVNMDDYPSVRTTADLEFVEVIGNIYDKPELVVDKQESVCPEFMEYLKGIEKSERLKEKYGFAPYENVYEEYCRMCKHYNMDVPTFEEWVPREEYRREVLCRTDEKYANYKFVSYIDYKKD